MPKNLSYISIPTGPPQQQLNLLSYTDNMTRSNPSKNTSKKTKVITSSPKQSRKKQDIIPTPPPPPYTTDPESRPQIKGITTALDLSPPITTLPVICVSTNSHSSEANLSTTPDTSIQSNDLPIEATYNSSVLTVTSSLTTQGTTTQTSSTHTSTINPITITLTTLDHRLTTLQNLYAHEFSVLTERNGLTDVNSHTLSVHKIIRDHVDACIHRNSSVLQKRSSDITANLLNHSSTNLLILDSKMQTRILRTQTIPLRILRKDF